jgi:hypothetical protein
LLEKARRDAADAVSIRGGLNMPPKIDRHDYKTPSGRFPTVITNYHWDRFEAAGEDMRWFVVPHPFVG